MSELQYTKAAGIDLIRVVRLIDNAVDGEPTSHVSMACLAIAITCQSNDVEPQVLADGIKGASEWIACYLKSASDNTDKKELN